MPRRFALALLTVLLLALAALVAVRIVKSRGTAPGRPERPVPMPTPDVPPTPIPPRPVALYFESSEDGRFHAEARGLASSSDDIALLRSVVAAVLDGPRRPELLRPFPEGWGVRAAYRMKDGLVVLDLSPPAPPAVAEEEGGEAPSAPKRLPAPAAQQRWETGSSEEWNAAQSLVLSAARNVPDVKRVILLVGGEPVDTLAGHVDLSHPLVPDTQLVAEGPVLSPPDPEPTAAPEKPAPETAAPGTSAGPPSTTPAPPEPAPPKPATARPSSRASA